MYKYTNSKYVIWTVWASGNSKTAFVHKQWGYEGLKQQTTQVETQSKNVGKKNETTPLEQACRDIQGEMAKKLRNGYTFQKRTQITIKNLFPMLAHVYEKKQHKAIWPMYAQPKLDGMRCLAHKKNGEVTLRARSGKKIVTLPFINEALKKIMPENTFCDGEIYKHGWSLQEIIAAIKDEDEDTKELEYWIYDIPNDKPWKDRLQNDLISLWSKAAINTTVKCIVPVGGQEVADEEKAKTLHDKLIQEGYEGLILRNMQGKYLWGKRSSDLLKLKVFQDNEFKIIGGKDNVGQDKGCVTFICETKEGKSFEVRPTGSRELRRKWFKELDSLIGKQLTVKFFKYTDGGIPFLPTGVCIRDYE